MFQLPCPAQPVSRLDARVAGPSSTTWSPTLQKLAQDTAKLCRRSPACEQDRVWRVDACFNGRMAARFTGWCDMSSDTDPRDQFPHAPRHDARVRTEGFASGGLGQDIFHAAVHATRMPMVVADPRQPDTPLVFANEAFLEMTGYSIAEILGKNCRFLQGPDTDPSTVALIGEAIRAEKELTVELLNYRKDGSTFWNALFLTPVRGESGELLYYFSSQLDVSRRRDAEAALRQAQKMEALGQLTGGIAHDFNNLLQVITGNAEVATARARNAAPDDALLSRALSNVKAAAARSGALTQQLLAFARKQQLQGRVVSVNDAIARTVDMAASSLQGVRVQLELDPSVANARLDPSQFETALLNLLVNARDAMPDGGRVWVVPRHGSLLHHESRARRHGSGPVDGLRLHQAKRRHGNDLLRGARGHHGASVLPCGRRCSHPNDVPEFFARARRPGRAGPCGRRPARGGPDGRRDARS